MFDSKMKKLNLNYERGGTQKQFYQESEVIITACPFCEEKKYREIHKERGCLGIVRCVNCGLIYVNPRLKEPEKVYWGDADKYLKEAKLIFEGQLKHHRDPNYLQDLKLIRRYKPSGNFLDVGTNMGFFLRNARGHNWNLYGVEPSPSLSSLARERFGLNVKTAFLEEAGFENNFFDIVSMTDVFEHISQPKKILSEVRRILKPDGVFFIKVPNGHFNLFKLRLARLMGKLKNYDLFDSYEHLVHYSHATLQKMLNLCGFKMIKACVGRPIQLPVWHNYVGAYYQYPCPWSLDFKRQSGRILLYYLSLIEFKLRLNRTGYLAPNIITIAKKR